MKSIRLSIIAIACGLTIMRGDARAGAGWPGRLSPLLESDAESLETRDGRRVEGRLTLTGSGRLVFRTVNPSFDVPEGEFQSWTSVEPRERGLSPAFPFQFVPSPLGKLSGNLVRLDSSGTTFRMQNPSGDFTVATGGLAAIIQTPGEFQVLADSFEDLDLTRWSQNGNPSTAAEPESPRGKSLRLPAGGSSITTRLSEDFAAGRLDVAFLDDASQVAGHRWFVDLTFRKPNSELGTIRTVVGWNESTLAVETPGGPSLNVQPLMRKPGWHQLAIKFDDRDVLISVDGDELAHGQSLGGSVFEIRVATETIGRETTKAPADAIIDDLRLVRFAEPSGRVEIDPTQDEIRLSTGDQLFGRVVKADSEQVAFRVGDNDIVYRWSDVSGIHLRRAPATSKWIDGFWARVEWEPESGAEEKQWNRVEGAIVDLNDEYLTLEIPFLGRIKPLRSSLRRIEFLGRSRRILIDPSSHHVGDRVDPDLDPPQPEMSPIEIDFELPNLIEGRGFLSMDVVQLIGVEGTPPFSDQVRNGELLTTISINGKELGDLNHIITSRNDEMTRIRIPIDENTLKVGRNVLKITQSGTQAEPTLRDNFGFQSMAIEVTPTKATTP